jgi:hypothetical protein
MQSHVAKKRMAGMGQSVSHYLRGDRTPQSHARTAVSSGNPHIYRIGDWEGVDPVWILW